MKTHVLQTASRPSQSGYALLLVMFFLALLVLSLAAAAPTVLSTIQRERETEMVWRGKQYIRGVRMYYLKMHHFPTSLDDLTKPKTGIRFMRQAYKDPMNLTDGSWRLIYVGPNGALIGSLNNRTISLSGMATGMPGAQGGLLQGGSSTISTASGTFGSSAFGGSQPGAINQTVAPGAVSTSGSATANPSGTNAAPGTPDDSSAGLGQPQPIVGSMDASNTIGGNIIGVGSKINKKSFMIYQKAKNYRQFEFIWDPSQDLTVGRASTGIGTPIGNQNNTTSPAGSSPFGSPFSSGVNPNQNPNQNQNQGQTPSSSPNQNPGNPETPLQAPPNP